MDLETRLLIDKLGMALGASLVLLALIGELLGWWADLGIVLALVGMVAGILSAMDFNGSRSLSNQGTMLSNQESMLENQGSMLENQGSMLENQESMLENQTKMVRSLDRIVEILDERLPRA